MLFLMVTSFWPHKSHQERLYHATCTGSASHHCWRLPLPAATSAFTCRIKDSVLLVKAQLKAPISC